MSEIIISEKSPNKAMIRPRHARTHPDIRERINRYGIGAISTQDLIVAILGTGTSGHSVHRVAREVLHMIA
ncbi:MAG: hypothetical protein N3A02_01510, partial [Rectinema sp.]|nr:hypothetical protein [Rectinema sp.]